MKSATRRARMCNGVLWATVLLIVLSAHSVQAQPVANSFDELQSLLKRGDTVDVRDAKGRNTHGKIGQLTAASLEILVRRTDRDGRDSFVPVELAERDVRQIRIEHRDSVLNGTAIGAAIAGGPFFFMGAAARGGGSCGSDSNVCPAVGLILAPIGAGVGAAIDAAKHRRTTVFDVARRSAVVQVAPIASATVRAVQVSVRF